MNLGPAVPVKFAIARFIRKATDADAYHERYCINCGHPLSNLDLRHPGVVEAEITRLAPADRDAPGQRDDRSSGSKR